MCQLGLTRREPALGLALTNKPALVVVSFWFPALVPRYHFANARMAAGGFALFSSCSIYAYLCRYLLSVSATADVREAIECKHQIHRLTKERNHICLDIDNWRHTPRKLIRKSTSPISSPGPPP